MERSCSCFSVDWERPSLWKVIGPWSHPNMDVVDVKKRPPDFIPPAIITSDAAGGFITQTWMKKLSQSQIFSPQNIASIGPGRILFCSSSLITRDPSITASVSGVIMFFSQQPYKDVITPLEKEATQHSILCKPATKQNPPNQTTECDFCN